MRAVVQRVSDARVLVDGQCIGEIERGNWRKYNPYNPYVEDATEEKANDLKVESLDDLFDDDTTMENEESNNTNNEMKETLDIKDSENMEEIPPILPQENEEDTYDLQKELEAKFDELFGPIDDE